MLLVEVAVAMKQSLYNLQRGRVPDSLLPCVRLEGAQQPRRS